MKASTILIREDLPYTRQMAASFSAAHQGEKLCILLLDDPQGSFDTSGEPFELFRIADLNLSLHDFHRMAAIYDLDELRAAVRPWLLLHLLDTGAEIAIDLDPGIEIPDSLAAIAEQTKERGVVVAAGQAFVSVAAGGRPVLDWWSQQLWHEGEHVFRDGATRRWIDAPPAGFEQFFAEAAKGDPAVNISEHPPEGRESSRPASGEPRGLEFAANGFRITSRVRGTCRYFHSLGLNDPVAGAQEMPDPFVPAEADDFIAWLNGPDPRYPDTVSRYLVYLHKQSPDLRAAFPNLWQADDTRGYLRWAARGGNAENPIPPELVPADVPHWENARKSESGAPKPGFNIAGYMNTELGLGEAARLMVSVMDAGGIPYSIMPPFEVKDFHAQDHFPEGGVGEAEFSASLICINANELPEYIDHVGSDFLEDRYNIGYWGWEVEVFPEAMARNAHFLDEIWVYTPHVQKIIAPMVDKPVYCCPPPVRVSDPPPLAKADFGLPEKFMFCFSFDFNSSIERKNPEAVIAAFKQAFSPGEGPILVIKSIRSERAPDHLAKVTAEMEGRSDIFIIDRFLPREEQTALMNVCDAYVSLHRAEGFGLTMAEAMAQGKPVIATAYSGNLVFMDDENSFLVPYDFTLVPPNSGQYPPGARWAEADISAAAGIMRSVYENPELAKSKAERGRRDIMEKHSPTARVKFVLGRMAEIQQIVAARTSHVEPAERAGAFLRKGPDVNGPAKYRRLVPFIRKMTLRLLRHYDIYQRQTSEAMLDAIRVLEKQVSELIARENLEEQQVDNLRRNIDRFGANFYETTGLTLSTNDGGSGRKVIGYRDSAGDRSEEFYAGFEDVFRGSEEVIRDRLDFYLGRLKDRDPVVDLGCGRGEMLDLLGKAGVSARGVDSDPGMVRRCRAKGHDVTEQDALEYLAAQPDGSIEALFSAQMIEHLPYEKLLEFLELANLKLKPGGLLISETVNPHSIVAMKSFWLDLSHQKPIYPETAVVLHRLFGFREAIVFFPGGSGDLEKDRRERGDYAVIAVK